MQQKILVTGSNGYVGNQVLIFLANAYPHVQIIGMSRRGTPRSPDVLDKYPKVSFIAGDCLDPESFKSKLEGVTGCVHTVGLLYEQKNNAKRTYAAVNRDAAINVARELNSRAPQGKTIPFVYISSEKGLPLVTGYITTKLEAEKAILHDFPHLSPVVLRPGFVWNYEQRAWSLPLKYACDITHNLREGIFSKIISKSSFLDQFFPAHSTKLETLARFAVQGAVGELQKIHKGIVSNELMLTYERTTSEKCIS